MGYTIQNDENPILYINKYSILLVSFGAVFLGIYSIVLGWSIQAIQNGRMMESIERSVYTDVGAASLILAMILFFKFGFDGSNNIK